MALGFGNGPVSLVWVCGEQNGSHTWDPIENRSGSENPPPWKMPRSPGLFLIKPTSGCRVQHLFCLNLFFDTQQIPQELS